MKKQVVITVMLFLFVMVSFGMQDGEYMFKILNIEAATETVSFERTNDNIIDFNSLTDLHFQMQEAVYSTTGKIKDNIIVDYQLTLFFNGAEIKINCTINDDILHYTSGNISDEVKFEKPLLILDNNLAWTWQLVYNLYQINGYDKINVFVPQLLLKDFTDILTLEIQKTTETEDFTNVFFSYNGQSGMLKVDNKGQVIQMLMSGTIMERTK